MNNFFKIAVATALTGLAAIGFASASFTSTPAEVTKGSGEGHITLVEALLSEGVNVQINPKKCGKIKVSGYYHGPSRALAICQDNGTPGGPAVAWTDNDLDTLRHEAQHFIQDCLAGSNFDQVMVPVYRSPTRLAQATLGEESVASITQSYLAIGADDLTLLLEYEAFAVAAMNNPLDQVQDIIRACGGKG